MALRRERLIHDGPTLTTPLPNGEGTGLGKPLKLIAGGYRSDIPIWWASLMPKSVVETARLANGWIPTNFVPDAINDIWGDDLKVGLAKRDEALGPLQVSVGTQVAIGDQFTGQKADSLLDLRRDQAALYWGGMGARDQNFYNRIARLQGYEAEAVKVQDLYLDGHKAEAATAIPRESLERSSLVGPKSLILERLAAWKEAGITVINVSLPPGKEALTLESLRLLVAEVS